MGIIFERRYSQWVGPESAFPFAQPCGSTLGVNPLSRLCVPSCSSAFVYIMFVDTVVCLYIVYVQCAALFVYLVFVYVVFVDLICQRCLFMQCLSVSRVCLFNVCLCVC